MGRKAVIRQWCQIVGDLAVFAFGVHLTIYANIGLAPWDCLGMGISNHNMKLDTKTMKWTREPKHYSITPER